MKNFDDEVTPAGPPTPVEQRTFVLAGETIMRVEDAPAFAIFGLGISSADDVDSTNAAQGFTDAILSLIEPASRDAFTRAVKKQDAEGRYLVSMARLTQVYEWLMGEVAQRPPTQPSVSSGQPVGNGTALTPGSPSQGLTPVASASGGS